MQASRNNNILDTLGMIRCILRYDTKRAMIGYIILFGILLLIVLGYFPEPAHEIHFRLQRLAAVSI